MPTPNFTEIRLGALDYRRRPWDGRAWGGPFNGQAWRCRLVAELILKFDPVSIVETGTYLGTTTEWLSGFQLPVYSCEASERNFGFAQQRLGRTPNVHLMLCDSRAGLRWLISGALADKLQQPILLYLDAHWNDDLPLAEELDIVFGAFPRAVVMIDDFQVPEDPGYTFDDYGPGKALTCEYVAPVMSRHELGLYYPARSSHDETGARRGCAVLAKKALVGHVLHEVALLRAADDITGQVLMR
jgi:hypothetical protein